MPVIEPVPWEHLSPELRATIEAELASGLLSTTVPSRILAYRPELAANHLARNRALADGVLDERLRELVRLRMASFNDCEPCQAARKSDRVGEDDVRCLASDAPRFTARERAALHFAELFVTDHFGIDRQVYAGLAEHFTTPEIVELAVLVAGVFGTGRLTHTLEVFSADPPTVPYRDELAPTAARHDEASRP